MNVVEREVVVAGIRSPLLEAAPEGRERAGEAVVFVHGNPGSSEDWRGLLAEAGAFARALAFDMPCFGRAEKPRRFGATLDGYAEHLAAALAQLGVTRAHLVLHDFGGPWGLEWASRHPERFASAVLIDTGVFTGFRWHRLARLWRTPVVGELLMLGTTRARFTAALAKSDPRLPAAFVARMARDYDAATKRAVLSLYRSTDLDALSNRQTLALTPLRRPALVLWGAKDRFLGKRVAEAQRAIFAVEAVELLPESGHWPMADSPGAVARAVVPFLRKHLSR